MLPGLTGTDQDACAPGLNSTVAGALWCTLTYTHTHTHALPILEHCNTSFQTVNKAEMPDSHVPMPGETYLLPEEMPAAAATIQEGICYCIMSNPPTLTLHWQCSSPQGPTRVFRLYLSLYMLMYKKQT